MMQTDVGGAPGASLLPHRIEWPTVAVAIAIGGLFAAAVLTHEVLPAPLTVAILAVAGAWYGSLQHEVIHGHPTPWARLNVAMAVTPLTLIVPFRIYREAHLFHHQEANLTDPTVDPESTYCSPERWARASRVERAFLVAMRTLAGRMFLRPLVMLHRRLRGVVVGLCGADRRSELGYLVAVAAVLVVVYRTGLPLWQYVLGAGYFSLSLTNVRSFAEHRAVAEGSRTAVVHAGLFWRMLFLNNSLHITHHARPGVAWYELPALHERLGFEADSALGAGVYRGYGELFRRHLFRPFCQVVHPLS